MGMEVVCATLALDAVGEANIAAEVEKVDIKFGSHGAEEPAKGELNKHSESNFPKDVVDEWPEPMQIHSFYIVKYRAFEDPNLKAKFDVADKELQKKNQARSQIFEKLKTKRAERAQIRTQIHSLSAENKQFKSVLDEKKKEMEPLQQALGKLRGSSGARERGSGLCSSVEELNGLIKSFQYRIQHESIALSEEKQILREIKQLEGTREKVIANAAERVRIQESLGEKESIQDQVKSIGVDLDGVRKEKQVVFAKIKQLDEEKLVIEKEISALEEELTEVTQKRDKILESITEMRKRREEVNSPFYNNRTILAKARILAANKDVDAVKELSKSEVENFMAPWNVNKAFRNDYESRILQSLDMRQLSKDGRMRNFNEKPLVVERAVASETEVVKTSVKQNLKEEVAPPEQKEVKGKVAKNLKEGNKKTESTTEKIDREYEVETSPPVDKPQKDEIDEKKLKELKREEEIAKRNQAEERKRKQAEKAAAKAAVKAEKEAEKKLKEREKRTRKKSRAAVDGVVDSEEPTETDAEVAEAEKLEEKVETAVPVPQKNPHPVRQRARPRGPDSLPRAILKRKKATNYWVWAAPAALVIIVLLVIAYSYLS